MLCLRWRRLFSRSYSHATCHSDRRQYLWLSDRRGWVYTGQRYGPDHKASYYPAYNEDEKATVHVYVWVDDNTSISFNIIDPKEKNITVYSDIEKMDNDQTIYTDAVFKDGNKQEERLEDGIVNITRFDLNNRIISGTFEGRRVTEGRFDLTF